MTKRRFWKSLLTCTVVAAMAFTLAACNGGDTGTSTSGAGGGSSTSGGTSGAAGEQEYGGVLKIVNTAEGAQPIGVPWECVTNDTLLLGPSIESLVVEGTDGEIEPWLATSWEIDMEGKEVVFQLREGVKFHDGTDFNAEAAVFCLNNAIEAAAIVGFTEAEVRGDYEIAIKFEVFQNHLMGRLAGRSIGFISPTAFEKEGIEWARDNPVGTGPFQFESFTRGDALKFTRFEDYWGENEPYLDGITYLFIRDEMTQQAAMQTDGEQSIDVLNTTSGEQTSTLQNLGMNVDKMAIGPVSLVPSSTDPDSPLANPDVRRAISFAIDRDSIVAARGFGVLTPATQVIPEGWSAHLPAENDVSYDVDKAKELLADAGYPDGFSTKLIAMPGFADKDAVVAMQSMLEEVGITAELEFPDAGGYSDYRSNGWDGMLVQHVRTMPNANNGFIIYFTTETSLVSLARPEGLLDAIDAAAKTETLEADKVQAAHQILMDDMTVIPIYDCYDNYVSKPKVHDGEFTQWGSSTIFLPNQAWMEQG